MSRRQLHLTLLLVTTVSLVAVVAGLTHWNPLLADSEKHRSSNTSPVVQNAIDKVRQGENIFRFDTFGDQVFWGDTLKLHQAIEGAKLGGVGPGVSPKTALAVGLKIDIKALPRSLVEQLKRGEVNLDDPAVTLALLKLNSVVGLTGFFEPSGKLRLHRSATRRMGKSRLEYRSNCGARSQSQTICRSTEHGPSNGKTSIEQLGSW